MVTCSLTRGRLVRGKHSLIPLNNCLISDLGQRVAFSFPVAMKQLGDAFPQLLELLLKDNGKQPEHTIYAMDFFAAIRRTDLMEGLVPTITSKQAREGQCDGEFSLRFPLPFLFSILRLLNSIRSSVGGETIAFEFATRPLAALCYPFPMWRGAGRVLSDAFRPHQDRSVCYRTTVSP
jgi:hypothetical protein